MIFSMEHMLKGLIAKPEASWAKDYATAMLKEMEKRFPQQGTKVEVYCFGNILHPFFRGSMLKHQSTPFFNDQVHKFLRDNETVEPVEPQPEPTIEPNLSSDDSEDFFAAAEKLTQDLAEPQADAGPGPEHLTPLKIELQNYFNMAKLNSSKVDVLQWWKANQVIEFLFRRYRRFAEFYEFLTVSFV